MSAAARWLRFTAGGLEAMVPAAAVRRTLPAPDPLPEAVDLAGAPCPVVDLAAVAAVVARTEPPALLLILDDGEARVALPVAEVGGLMEAASERIEPLPWPYDAEGAWCTGVVVPEDGGARPVLVVDPAALARTVTVAGGFV